MTYVFLHANVFAFVHVCAAYVCTRICACGIAANTLYLHTYILVQLSTLWCGTQAWKYGSTPPAIPKDWKASLLMPLQRYGKSAWALPRETRRKAIHKMRMETKQHRLLAVLAITPVELGRANGAVHRSDSVSNPFLLHRRVFHHSSKLL